MVELVDTQDLKSCGPYTSVRVRFPLRVLFKRQLRKAAWIVSCVVARQARDELLRNSFDSRSGYFFNVNFFAVARQHELFRAWSRGKLAIKYRTISQQSLFKKIDFNLSIDRSHSDGLIALFQL